MFILFKMFFCTYAMIYENKKYVLGNKFIIPFLKEEYTARLHSLAMSLDMNPTTAR